MNTSFVKSEVKASPSRSPHLREYKTVLDSGFYALDSAFQSPGSPIPPSKFQDSGFRIWIPLHGTSLGLQANPFNCCASFSSRRWGRITQEYSQIISTSSRWVKKVELYYTSMLTCIAQDMHWPILETEDSTIQHCLTPARVNIKYLCIARNDVGFIQKWSQKSRAIARFEFVIFAIFAIFSIHFWQFI